MPVPDTVPQHLDRQTLEHFRFLSVSSVKQYRQWCVSHGFSPGLNKHRTAREEELRVASSLRKPPAHELRRQEDRRPCETLLAICLGKLTVDDLVRPSYRDFAKAISLTMCSKTEPTLVRASITQLVQHLVESRSRVLDWLISNDLGSMSSLGILVRVAQYHAHWLRPLAQWKPRSHSGRRQLRSLLSHLFVKYEDLPEFFDAAWGANDDGSQRRWFIHVGLGNNLRHCDLPIDYTKRMAHHFMMAPRQLTILQAIRYGQVMGFGGQPRDAMAILGSRLGENFEQNDFWETVVRWLLQHPMLDRSQWGPIIDFIHFQRFVSGADEHPAQPNFSMKGRTPESLLAQVDRWHARLNSSNRVQVQSWPSSGMDEFRFVEGDVSHPSSHKVWTIRELLSAQALFAEGRTLKHCVASYASSCAHRRTSIWTMEMESCSQVTKLLTLEVRPGDRALVQIRGKLNRLATEKEMSVIGRWVAAAGLRVASGV